MPREAQLRSAATPATTAAKGTDPVPAHDGIVGRRGTLVLVGAGILLVGFAAGNLATGPGYGRFAFLYDGFTIEDCLARGSAGALAVTEAQEAVLACYEKLRLQGALNDFQVRRVSFQSQHFADAVVMWMVVLMTLSGVALAGYQIVTASRLSPEAMPDSEFSIERGRLFVRSSVTGLLILIVSFAFFFTYIVYVYTIYDLGEDPPLTAGGGSDLVELLGPELDVEGALVGAGSVAGAEGSE